MKKLPIVLLHGYSDIGEGFLAWHKELEAAGHDATMVHLGNYVSLSNEITIKDIAEGFDRALRNSPIKEDEPFDVIVHSTGMLVIREWLAGTIGTTARPELAKLRQKRLKHLIGLAPATFGSPMAHKGRSWLGAIFKGGKEPGPDFMEAGDQVLRGLELGSSYTWDLAHRDFLQDPPVYGASPATPYPFIFMGLNDYGWIKRIATESGTDGTVRWSGTGFNSRKSTMDLTVESTMQNRIFIHPWKNAPVPLIFLADQNHSDILRKPGSHLVKMVLDALKVKNFADYEEWTRANEQASQQALAAKKAKRWQQFIVHAVDERGDGIKDYFIEVGTVVNGRFNILPSFSLDVHSFREDESYRCFHADLDKLKLENGQALALRIIASSGTDLVGYHGYSSNALFMETDKEQTKWDAVIEFDATIGSKEVRFFNPYTTSLVEIMLNREPLPLQGKNKVFWFG
jgi:hypothetical protein